LKSPPAHARASPHTCDDSGWNVHARRSSTPATLSRWQAAPRLVPVALVEDVTVARDVHLTVLLPSGLRVEHIPLADLRRVIEALA
jgi:hypothetical protein